MIARIGERFGNYQLVRLLGQGGFAEVYLGKHIHLASQVAIKILHSQLVQHEQEEFLQEARLIASLDHPSIVHVLDCGIEHNTPFLIMNYAPHGTLRQRHPKGTQIPLVHVLFYLRQVASALQYAHELKVIHRDIKPENMLVGSHGEILLSDFGIALISSSSSSQSTKAAAGTVAYMAPEQIIGKPRLASDQYALGVVIYEWLCGERPFSGSFAELCAQHLYASPPSMRAKNHLIAPEIESVVMRSLAKEPQKRFASVRDFMNSLEQAALPAVSSFTSTLLPSPFEDASTIGNAANDSTFVKASVEDAPTRGTPDADLTAVRSQSDVSTFVKHSPEVSSQQSLSESSAPNIHALSYEQRSQAFSYMSTLSEPITAQLSGTSSTTGQRPAGPLGVTPDLTTTVEMKTRQRRIPSWLFITLTVFSLFTLITGPLVFTRLAAHSSTNKTGVSVKLPTTSGGQSDQTPVGNISPTVTVKGTSAPGLTATVDPPPVVITGHSPTSTPDPSPTSVPPTLTTSPSNILVTNLSKYCNVDTHGGNATDMTCSVVLNNTSRTSSTLNWSASMNPQDYTISPVSGSIAPGKSTTITFYTYSGVPCPATQTLIIKGSANTVQIPIVCTYLFVRPTSNTLNSSDCTQNGDWTCVITIVATGDALSVPWQVSAGSSAGVSFSSVSGTLAPGESVQITITIASTDCPGYNTFTISGGSLVNPSNYFDWNC